MTGRSWPLRFAVAALFPFVIGCGDEPTGGGGGVDRIVLSASALSLDAVGAVDTLRATALDADGQEVPGVFSWSTSDPSAVRVTPIREGARVDALRNGVATVSVSRSGAEATATVTVEQRFDGMTFGALPAAVLSGTDLTLDVVVADRLGQPLGDANGVLDLEVATSGSVLLMGTRQTTLSAGRARFTGVELQGGGLDQRLRAVGGAWSGTSHAFDVVAAFDRVELSGAPAGAITGVLVDGWIAGGDSSDVGFVTSGAAVDVGSVRPGNSNEVVAFADGRAPTLLSGALWTDGTDTVEVTAPPPVGVDIVLWIVKGPFEQQRDWALAAVQRTREIWAGERYGIAFDSVAVIDSTTDPDAATFYRFDLCGARPDAQTQIGYQSGAINIYYVERVDGGTDRGRTCPVGGDFIVMAERSGDELLSHELGHAFGMGHVDGLTDFFDQTNIMHSASNTRAYVTEGQTFRSHLSPGSALNGALAVRSGVTRLCFEFQSSTTCPRLELRLWSDGPFPANTGGQPLVAVPRAPQWSSAAEVAERWLATTCMSDSNALLAEALREGGAPAIAVFTRRARDASRPLHERLNGLEGIARVGGEDALRALTGFLTDAEPALAREARDRLRALRPS